MRRVSFFVCLLLLLVFAPFLFADPMGRLRGTVKDTSGKPVDKVTITIESTAGVPQKYSTTTNEKGEYIHIGIKTGDYKITPSKEGYTAVQYAFVNLHISPSDRPEKADFVMQAATAASSGTAAENKEPPSHIKSAGEGVKLLNSGKYDEAISAFQKALQADPNLAEVRYDMGIAYERKGDPVEAQKQYQEAIQLKKDFGEAYLSLGNSYLAEKKFDQANEALSKATQLMPQNYDAFYNLGASYANLMKYTEAEAAFKKAIEISPNEPIAHYQLGMALYGQSKNAEAKTEFQKYLELKPNAADRKDVEDLINSL
jgi:tetratricopeptide (TPR) repeat protein